MYNKKKCWKKTCLTAFDQINSALGEHKILLDLTDHKPLNCNASMRNIKQFKLKSYVNVFQVLLQTKCEQFEKENTKAHCFSVKFIIIAPLLSLSVVSYNYHSTSYMKNTEHSFLLLVWLSTFLQFALIYWPNFNSARRW